jgi:Restriction endonuclease BglII
MSRCDEPEDQGQEEEPLPPSSTVNFLHAVGQSTVRQGITVPVIAQIAWLSKIQKGRAIPVTIKFGKGESVPATLRRINNARGHLQFRYESKKQASLRDYLTELFGSRDQANGVLRVSESEPHVFLFEPVSAGRQSIAALSLFNPHFHNCNHVAVWGCHEFKELGRCLTAIPYNEEHNQSDYNKEIKSALSSMGWNCETRILTEIGLRCDFEKNGVWVEVEFGNARVYYQDYIKFLLALRHRTARLGILLCPTNAFAQLLCDLGQRRARVRSDNKSEHRASYSGMMSYEKAMRELPFLEFFLTGSIVIAGIEIQGR